MKTLIRTVSRALVRGLMFGLVVPLLWLIEPVWRIRLTHMWSARFGPLCFSTHTWVVRRRLEGPERRTWRLFFGARPANRQIWEMWRREVPLVESRALSAAYHWCGPDLPKSRFFQPLPEEFDNHALPNHPAGLSFTADEERRGRALLEVMGLGPNDWYITFQARDPVYHQTRANVGDSGAHHNCEVESFLAAARHVTALGGFAIRMGAAAEKPLPATGDPRIIDYARDHRSDFGDVFLFAHCRFHLGCSTGSNFCPVLFNRPVAQANMMPLRPVPTGRHGLYNPVLLRETATGRLVPFAELERLGAYEYVDLAMCARWQYPGGMEKIGLEIVNNSSDDILGLCCDMLDRLEGRPADSEAAEVQAWYKRRFLAHVPTIESGPDVAPRFILNHISLFAE
jgi:putative glycosyltransferase (TIGR04372 family)